MQVQRPGWMLLGVLLLLLAGAAGVPAEPSGTESWLCPLCQTTVIQREAGSSELSCEKCGQTMTAADLGWTVGHLCIRTRPTQVLWDLFPECGIFRNEGLVAYDKGETIWVPWNAVEYYIPRMRILRLTSGKELLTPYANTDCKEDAPQFVVAVADSVGDFLSPMILQKSTREEVIYTTFICARSRQALDAGRDRFVREVEEGKHPRLPRTQPGARNLVQPTVPQSAAGDSLDVIFEVRGSESGQILKVTLLQGSGNPEVDRAALLAAKRSPITIGGEMGVGVPCSMVYTYRFRQGTAFVDAAPADPPMWREWISPE